LWSSPVERAAAVVVRGQETAHNRNGEFATVLVNTRRADASTLAIELAMHPPLTTSRLLLRPWRDDDLEPFAALNADPRVMEYFPATLDRTESDANAARIRTYFAQHGYGLWGVEELGGAPFIGYVGLSTPRFEAPFMPAIEIGWRLGFAHWGKGYAREAAYAALDFGFGTLNLNQIVSFTTTANQRSRRVMEAIGMNWSAREDFDHPMLPEAHPLRRHVLYRITRQDWEQMRKR
jgi:RimJ/RimL family protein N-acetyltransferase